MTAGDVVDGSTQKNQHGVRKRAVLSELTQGITIRDQNSDDLAESEQLLTLKCILLLERQIQL